MQCRKELGKAFQTLVMVGEVRTLKMRTKLKLELFKTCNRFIEHQENAKGN